MSVPLHQAKAASFRMPGHLVRMRVPELLLQDGPMPVRGLPAAIGGEPPGLSRQLAALRRAGIVGATRVGPTVGPAVVPAMVHEPAGGDVADLTEAARRILTDMPAGRDELSAGPREKDGTVAR